MGRILFTGIARRSIDNWLPALRELRDGGHEVRMLLFPHLADPDSSALESLDFDTIGTFPFEEGLSRLPQSSAAELAASALATIRSSEPDVVLLTTCHAGPELALAEALAAESRRPVVMGCQHGFVQNWEAYWDHFHFDRLLVFGSLFRDMAPGHLADRVVVGGLPKLDLIDQAPGPEFDHDARPILFAAQMEPSDELRNFLASLSTRAGRPLHIRPHPEHREAFADIVPDSGMLDVAEPIADQLRRHALLLTTGSTTVLEAMAAGMPVVVLPEQRGDQYAGAGIVAPALDVGTVLDLARAQQTATGRLQIARFLERSTASATGGRARLARRRIEAGLVPTGR
jgi:hypothetical protein